MSEQTKIAWCDSTLNFWEGCTKVSAGCAHCYAEARDKRFAPVNDVLTNEVKAMHWGKGAPRRKSKSAVKDALAFNRKPWICECGNALAADFDLLRPEPKCEQCGKYRAWHRRRIFSLSLGDWLDDEVPIAWLAEMLDTIRQCDQVEWILCTKRPENWEKRLNEVCKLCENTHREGTLWDWTLEWMTGDIIPKNIILLTSVENQEQADIRIPQLLQIPAACRGLSLEPLLGPVNLMPHIGWIDRKECGLEEDPMAASLLQTAMLEGRASAPCVRSLDWLIIGGESGPDARPCNVDWIRSLVQQGKAAGVATFVKQLGAVPLLKPCGQHHFDWRYKTANEKRPDDKLFSEELVGNQSMWRILLTDKKGGDPAEWPEDLRVQEWPKLVI